ncbi:MAG: Rne/Rng family ribonuclease [Pseudomonadota bacterium]
MAKKMLIDATHPEETRVVVMDGTKVDEFDFESINKRQLAGNIYLAKVTRVEPSLQAAFVEYGGNRHGFLAFSEIHPDYYQIPVADREALIAAEEAAQAEDDDDEPKEAKKPKSRRSSRSRSRGRKKADSDADNQTEATDNAAADGDGNAAPEAETKDEPSAETADAPVEEQIDAAAAADSPSEPESLAVVDPVLADEGGTETEDGATDADDDSGSPRSIAESAGMDDEDSVSEDVVDTPPAADRSTATEDTAQTEAASGSETAEADDEVAPETETEAEVAEKPKSSRARSSRSPRKRGTSSRSRKSDSDDNADEDSTDEDTPADKPETVGAEKVEDEVRPRRLNHRRYKIQEVIKVRQILLVQVVKEERGNKGAALTTYLSLAGRYCVLMPNTARGGGISRKITQPGDRKKLKEIAGELEVPKGMGLIIRTAGAQRTKTEIKRDYEFLLRQWDQVRELTLKSSAPALIYEEGSLIKRSIRDLYGRDIDAIVVEGEEAYREAKDYMKMLMPSHAKNVQPHREGTPLFSKYSVESHLSAMFNPTVQLKSGGYIVIGITEALVAIDVNSGRSTREHSIEETALKTNLEASDEVARQLRLRDLAGLIVIDYIDMEENRNNRAVEKRLKDRLKDDRARIQVGRISAFGLMEMSRQRLRPGMLEATTAPCAHCHGTGIVRSADNVALAILREVEEEAVRRSVREVKVIAPVAVANYIINQKRAHVASIEDRYGIDVLVEGDATLVSPDYKIEKTKGSGRPPRRNSTAQAAISAESAFEDVEEAEMVEEAAETRTEQQSDRRSDDGDGQAPKKSRRRGKRGGRRRGKRDNDETDKAADGAERSDDSPSDAAKSGAAAAAASDPMGEVIDLAPETEDTGGDMIVDTPSETAQKPKGRRPSSRSRKPKTADKEPEATDETAPATSEETAPSPAPEPEAETMAEPEPQETLEPQPEPEPQAEPEPIAKAEPPKPKRSGWWS